MILYTNAFPSKKANILIVHSSLKVHPIISCFIPVSCCSFPMYDYVSLPAEALLSAQYAQAQDCFY